MTKTKLLEKSRNYRNDCAIQRLAQLESLRSWAKQNNTPETPKFEKTVVERNKAGWVNFCKLVANLKP
jgi:hypothetical protein